MNKNNDDTILEILQGHRTARWPSARLVKIFIASTKSDFVEERRQLLETVGPELQLLYDEHQIEVELVDMHFGAGEDDIYDAYAFNDNLYEIQECHRLSKGCFFLCLIGNKYQPCVLPISIQKDQFIALLEKSHELGLHNDLLKKWYKLQNIDEDDVQSYKLEPRREMSLKEWKLISEELNELIQTCVLKLEDPLKEKMHYLIESAVEKQFSYALGLAPGTAHKMIAIIRDLENLDAGQIAFQDIEKDSACKPNERMRQQLKEFRERINNYLSCENRAYFSVPWRVGGIDEEDEDHETYLNKFRKTIREKLKILIDRCLEEDPELKSRKKIVQENFNENVTHLTMCYEPPDIDLTQSDLIDRIKLIIQTNFTNNSKHTPLLIQGNQGSGKTSLLKIIYQLIENWFSNQKVLRIIRFISKTPRSTYALELLRIICQQICIALRLPEGFLPKDASFDPLYINNWFQSLLRLFESFNQVLVIIIDDLHLLNPLDADIVAPLSWLPINLPDNVYIICTSTLYLDQLRLSPIQREKFKSQDCFLQLKSPTDINFNENVMNQFNNLEKHYGLPAVSKLATLITCSEYGLTETELLEILMPTSNSQIEIQLSNANFNFATLCSIRRQMKEMFFERLLGGKMLICWKHESIKEEAKKRYINEQELMKNTHAELVNLFFSEFSENESEESEEEAAEEPAPLPSDIKTTPFQSTLHSDVNYSQRHVDEAWIHLLKSGDISRLKSLTVCNFDFLLATVQTVSISYARCILEHVRCYLLDRELELVYHVIRRSTDVLTRDPLQLATQLILWLRPIAEKNQGILSSLLLSAMAWCDGFTLPLIVPLNGWLQPPLPAQSRVLTVPNVRLVEPSPTNQHVICIIESEPHLWHIMSNQLIHTFKGHSGRILCLTVTKQSQYLLTGSEDTSVIVWDLKTLMIHLKIQQHIAPVLTVTTALNNSVIVSGGEDSCIIVTSLLTGELIVKIDHHRGPVTSAKVTSAGDVLVSGSHDRTVCLWSLENFTLLNTIQMNSAVLMLDVSDDCVFLAILCSDGQLNLRALATGTELHNLTGHRARILSLVLAKDSNRAVVGCADGKTYVYDMHSARIIKTISNGLSGEITSVKITNDDDFLLTCGCNRIHFYPFKIYEQQVVKNKKQLQTQNHNSPVTSIDISRDGQLAATASYDHLINIWMLNSHELSLTLEGHQSSVTCLNFAPNSLFLVSGSDDKTIKIWGLTLGSIISTFTQHQSSINTIKVMMDSSRIISSDRSGLILIWLADNLNLIQSYNQQLKHLSVCNNMKYFVYTSGDNTVKIWSLLTDNEKYSISHSEEITCFTLTNDSLQVITGSKDMSLKIWQLSGGKLSQVLVGHTDIVTCVDVSLLDKNLIISGSKDTNLIVWDINTGDDLFTLSGHLNSVTCVKLTADGTVAVSGSEDKSIIVWDTKKGLLLTSLQLHTIVINLLVSSDASRLIVHLKDSPNLPIICLHNSPAKYVKLPTFYTPAKDIPLPLPKRQMKRLLKKEVSLDTYTWQKKYAHLTSNLMIAAVDERLKRRFSVSASMEEISKIPQNKTLGSQTAIAEGASLAQSQHFDQLEALWNKRSPPRRRLQQSLSKQSSLVESQLVSSDEECIED